MYLTSTTSYMRGGSTYCRKAPFLLLVVYYEPDGTLLGKRSKIRAFIVQAALHQVGHFMMGSVRIGKTRIALSGTYGADGLPREVTRDIWDRGHVVPDELERKFWESGGHNSHGEEGADFFRWGRELMHELEKSVRKKR